MLWYLCDECMVHACTHVIVISYDLEEFRYDMNKQYFGGGGDRSHDRYSNHMMTW